MKTELTKQVNTEVLEECFKYYFSFECFGPEIDLLNQVLEEKELTLKNSITVGKNAPNFREDKTTIREDGNVQLAFYGDLKGTIYLLIPNKTGANQYKKIRVFADLGQSNETIRKVCFRFIKTFVRLSFDK